MACVGVVDDEAGAHEFFLVVDRGTIQILVAHSINQDHDALTWDLEVVLVLYVVEAESIFEPRTPATLHKCAQFKAGVIFFCEQIHDLFACLWCDGYHVLSLEIFSIHLLPLVIARETSSSSVKSGFWR